MSRLGAMLFRLLHAVIYVDNLLACALSWPMPVIDEDVHRVVDIDTLTYMPIGYWCWLCVDCDIQSNR